MSEEEARPQTTAPTLIKLRISLEEIYALPAITQRMIEDTAFDLVGWLTERLGNRFARAEGNAFLLGNGVKRPRGILTYPIATTADATRLLGTLQYVPTGAAGAFAASNPADVLHDTVAALKPDYRANAAWMMNRTTHAVVRKMKTGTGDYLLQPGLAARTPDVLLGYPVVLAEDMPAIGPDSLSIAFGDFLAGYTVIERPGTGITMDPFTARPYVLAYSRRRVGGGLVDSEAIKLIRFSAT